MLIAGKFNAKPSADEVALKLVLAATTPARCADAKPSADEVALKQAEQVLNADADTNAKPSADEVALKHNCPTFTN